MIRGNEGIVRQGEFRVITAQALATEVFMTYSRSTEFRCLVSFFYKIVKKIIVTILPKRSKPRGCRDVRNSQSVQTEEAEKGPQERRGFHSF